MVAVWRFGVGQDGGARNDFLDADFLGGWVVGKHDSKSKQSPTAFGSADWGS